jgi:UDP-galactose transporter B1
VVGKSCKPIPVMLLGVLLGGKSYSIRKYLFILLIVVGVSLFLYNPNKAVTIATTSSTGELLLIMSLAMDGLTGAVQERMRSGSSRPNSATMMRMMNLFSLGYTLVALILTGEVFTFFGFVSRFPSVFWKIVTFSVTSALGQYFIYVCVSDFGPLPCSVVTTTRKFFTVLASVLIFGNVLTGIQWAGATLVFVGLSLDAVYK